MQVEDHEGEKARVNIRVPFTLLRAGVRLTALLPSGLHARINRGIATKRSGLRHQQTEAGESGGVVEQLAELAVDVDGGNGDKVRIYCE